MKGSSTFSPVDPWLVKGWLTARSLARGLPPPVDDHGGWRVDTNLPAETRRFVFARAEEPLRALAESIVTPLIFLKLCAPAEAMRALLPVRWQIQPGGYLMTCEGQPAAPTGPGSEVRIPILHMV